MKNRVWQLQDAKNRFSEVVEKAINEGAQTITRHGTPTAVILSVEDYAELCPQKSRTLLDWFRESPGGELSEILDKRAKDKVRDLDL